MPESSVTTLAIGSQNLAALIGFFCTDGVERNVLTFNLGWPRVVASSLSLLGVLGLVKSSIKFALGLRYCSAAGFDLDSLRDVFGFLPNELASSDDITQCDAITVTVSPGRHGKTSIHKKQGGFSEAKTPIIQYRGKKSKSKGHNIAYNLGNPRDEASLRRNPMLIALVLFSCSAMTTWPLMIIPPKWTWLKGVAIPGFHVCLIVLVGLSLWYHSQLSRPGKYLTVENWKILHDENPLQSSAILNILQVSADNVDVLHLRGNTTFITTWPMRLLMVSSSAFAVAAYICRYIILKAASSFLALIWIGCQGLLAILRLAFWTFNPPLKNAPNLASEYAQLNTTKIDVVTFSELICNTVAGATTETTMEIPAWALEFLLQKVTLKSILEIAASRKAADIIPTSAENLFLNVDFKRLIHRRWLPHDILETLQNLPTFRLGLRKHDESIKPFVMVSVNYKSFTTTTNSNPVKGCWVEAVPESPLPNCKLYMVDERGEQIHLKRFPNRVLNNDSNFDLTFDSDHVPSHTCTHDCWRSEKFCGEGFEDASKYYMERSKTVCKGLKELCRYGKFEYQPSPEDPNPVHVSGNAQRSSSRPRNVSDYYKGLREIEDYIENHTQIHRDASLWKELRRWFHKDPTDVGQQAGQIMDQRQVGDEQA